MRVLDTKKQNYNNKTTQRTTKATVGLQTETWSGQVKVEICTWNAADL